MPDDGQGWYDTGFGFVCARDRRTAAQLGRVPVGAVHGPFVSLQSAKATRARREAATAAGAASAGGGAGRTG